MSSCEHSLNTLRYADRVKELAASDPTETKSFTEDNETNLQVNENSNNSALSDSDLAQLISLNVSTLNPINYVSVRVWVREEKCITKNCYNL